MNLSLDGRGDEGIDIDRSTSLATVREQFPVPPEYLFGVPTKMEDTLRASEFLSLTLLKTTDTYVGTIRSRPLADHPGMQAARRENSELRHRLAEFESQRDSEVTHLYGKMARFEAERSELTQQLSAARSDLGG